MKKFFSIVFYGIACLFGLVYLIDELLPNLHMTEFGRLFLLGGSCLFLYLGGLFLSKIKSNNKPMKINLWIFFVLYIILLVTLTLFDSMWGRSGLKFINWFSDEFIVFIKNSINLIPFKTIIEFIKDFNSIMSNRTILLNLFSNFIALMPMSFFLLLLFEKQNKFKNFLITIFLIILGIELTQLLTASGRFDIDDILLNVSGATLMYFILKIKDVNHLIKNIFLLEKNKILKRSYILMLISILLVGLFAILVVQYRNKLYNDNYKILNPKITIMDESENTCDQALDLFYEDELYKYYFTCMKSDKVYAIINNEEKYLVKDFLKNETYNYSIKAMLHWLDFYKVSYIKENKYQYVILNVTVPTASNGSYSSPKVYVNIDNEDILDTKYDYKSDDNLNATYNYTFHFLPKASGSTNIEISFKDYDDNLLKTYQYSVIIDDKLNATLNQKYMEE